MTGGLKVTSLAGGYLTSLPVDRQAEITRTIAGFATEDRLFRTLLALQEQVLSGTVMVKRGPVILHLIREMGVPDASFETDTCETRQPSVNLTNGEREIVVLAHADNISYGVGEKLSGTDYVLVPLCAHRIKPGHTYPAEVVRATGRRFAAVAGGQLGTTEEGSVYFRLDPPEPPGGFSLGTDRVVLRTPAMSVDPTTKVVRGNMDNPAGVAVAIVMLGALAEVARAEGRKFEDLRAGILFTDWEEGLPDDQAFFARGTRLYLNRARGRLPRIAVVIDGHEQDSLGSHALLGSVSSRGRGTIVPPDVYSETMMFLQHVGVPVAESPSPGPTGSSLARSDDAAAIEAFGLVIPLGYGVMNSHANQGDPMAHLGGLVHTTQAAAHLVLQYAGFRTSESGTAPSA